MFQIMIQIMIVANLLPGGALWKQRVAAVFTEDESNLPNEMAPAELELEPEAEMVKSWGIRVLGFGRTAAQMLWNLAQAAGSWNVSNRGMRS